MSHPETPRQAIGLPRSGDRGGHRRPGHGSSARRPRLDAGGRLVNGREAIGEIVSRNGAARFEGYYANDEAEAERTRGGWYWSGDLGYRDEAGLFYFAGRPADWLRVDRENFAAAPVERILARCPARSPPPCTPSPTRAPATRSWPRWSWRRAPFDPADFHPFPGQPSPISAPNGRPDSSAS